MGDRRAEDTTPTSDSPNTRGLGRRRGFRKEAEEEEEEEGREQQKQELREARWLPAFLPCCCPLPLSLVWPCDLVLTNVMKATPQHFPA